MSVTTVTFQCVHVADDLCFLLLLYRAGRILLADARAQPRSSGRHTFLFVGVLFNLPCAPSYRAIPLSPRALDSCKRANMRNNMEDSNQKQRCDRARIQVQGIEWHTFDSRDRQSTKIRMENTNRKNKRKHNIQQPTKRFTISTGIWSLSCYNTYKYQHRFFFFIISTRFIISSRRLFRPVSSLGTFDHFYHQLLPDDSPAGPIL